MEVVNAQPLGILGFSAEMTNQLCHSLYGNRKNIKLIYSWYFPEILRFHLRYFSSFQNKSICIGYIKTTKKGLCDKIIFILKVHSKKILQIPFLKKFLYFLSYSSDCIDLTEYF